MARPPKIPLVREDRPSKTELKQESIDLQLLGETLTTLSSEQLDQLDLPELMRDALDELSRVGKHEATRRHMQYIGKLMRDVDTAPILARLSEWNGTSRQHIAWLHQVERWRDRLLAEPDALTELLAAYPGPDVQHLRALIRNAIKEKELNKPAKNYREIFQVLRDLIPEEALAQPLAQPAARHSEDDE